jgi:hypothetical protein
MQPGCSTDCLNKFEGSYRLLASGYKLFYLPVKKLLAYKQFLLTSNFELQNTKKTLSSEKKAPAA